MNKIRRLVALLLSFLMAVSIITPDVYAAEVATPTDVARNGYVVISPEGENGEEYEPSGEGADGVVYEVIDANGSKVEEFVLSHDGRAYADPDGETLVYKSGDKDKADRKEKKIELAAGKYKLRQGKKLYKSNVAVQDGAGVERDTNDYSFDIVSGDVSLVKIRLINKKNTATPSDAQRNTAVLAASKSYAAKKGIGYSLGGKVISYEFSIPKSLTYNNTGKGFCMEQGVTAPNGEAGVLTKMTNSDIRRALYYSYLGVEPWSGWSDISYGTRVMVLSCVLDHYYKQSGNNYHSSFGTNIDMAKKYVKWVEKQPIPDGSSDVNFKLNNIMSDLAISAAYNISGKMQKSSVMKLSGSGATVTVPSGVTLYTSSNQGKTYKKCNSGSYLAAGTWMYFTASLTKTGESTVKFVSDKGYDAYKLEYDKLQDIGFLGPGVQYKREVVIKWTSPNFRLKKTDSQGGPVENAEYLVYRFLNGKKTNVVRVKTDSSGTGNVISINTAQATGAVGDKIVKLKAGVRYYIVETKAPEGYLKNSVTTETSKAGEEYSFEAYFIITNESGHSTYTQISGARYGCTDTGVTYTSVDTAVTGTFAIRKMQLQADGSTIQKDGAVYTMYDSGNEVVARFTTKANDYASVSSLSSKYSTLRMLNSRGEIVNSNGIRLSGIPLGSYTIKETTAPQDCEIEPEGRHAVLNVTSEGQTLIYYRAEKINGETIWNRITDNSSDIICYDAVDEASRDPLRLVIRKVDAETGLVKNAGAASLENAVFKLEYYRGKSQEDAVGIPDSVWYIKTKNENGRCTAKFGNDFLIKNNDNYPSDPAPETSIGEYFLLDVGSIRITEVTPSDGYLNVVGDNAGYIGVSTGGKTIYIDDVPSVTVYLDGSGNTTYFNNVLDNNTLEIYEPVKRGDIEFSKMFVRDDGSLSPMANVVFKITSKTTGEYHYVATDSEGKFSSRNNSNTNNTNGNCREYMVTSDGYKQGEINSSYGLWFSGNADIACEAIDTSVVRDDRGALPYDTYIVEEMRCDANLGYRLSDPQEVTISENGQSVVLGDTFVNIPYPSITTLSDHSAKSGKSVTIKDAITMKWLKAGASYIVKGIVMDKDTGKAARDGDGRIITSVKAFTTPTSGSVNGYLPIYELRDDNAVEFNFNSTDMNGTYVIFEYLYVYEGTNENALSVDVDDMPEIDGVMIDDQGNLIAHDDIENKDGSQTFSVPKIETDAFADENGLQEIQASKNTRINDSVKLHDLVVGSKYRLETKIAFMKDGKEHFVKKSGEEYSYDTYVVAKNTDEEVVVKVPEFDATPYEGYTVTIYQYLYLVTDGGDVKIAEHTDIDNASQQIRFVGLHTTARDMITDENFTASLDEERERVDDVTCTNLKIGQEYQVTAYLYDQSTGQKVRNNKGEYVTGKKTFIADKANMVVPVTVKYNPVDCGLVGKTVVFFEYMTTLGKDVASHADLEDEGQSMRHPKLHTTLHESESGVKEIHSSGIVNLTDTADYSELKKGFTFDFVAKFINADTGNVINIEGKEAIVKKTVAVDSDEGTIEMDYSFDIQKSGLIKSDGTVSDVVCYEYVYYKGELIFAEEDIENRDQTIRISPINGKLTIHKRELQNKDKPIAGVTFMLFKKADTVIPTVDIENTDGMTDAQVKAINSWKNKTKDMYVDTYVTDENGDIVVTGLTFGEYYVVETKTLDTYKLCTDRPDFIIDGTHDVEITVTNEAKVGYITITGPNNESQGGGSTPNTGESTPLLFLLILFAIAVIGIILSVAYKKKKFGKVLLIILPICGIGMMLTPVLSVYASDDYITETSTEVYYTDDESTYSFDFAGKKQSGNDEYELYKVEYDKKHTSEAGSIDEQITKRVDDVSSDYKAPVNIKENGYTYILSDSKITENSMPVHVYTYKETGYLDSEPEHDATMRYTYVDKDGKEHDLELPYSRTEVLESGASEKVTYQGVVSGINYEYIQVGDKMIASSEFSLSADDMRQILTSNGYDVSKLSDLTVAMSPDTYRNEAGDVCRNYTITAYQTGTKYRFVYEDDVDGLDVTYKSVDVYVLSDADKEKIDKANNEVLVTATAYYKLQKYEVAQKGMTKSQKVIMSTAIILGILLLIALIVYLIRGGRRKTDYKSRRDIKRDFKNI